MSSHLREAVRWAGLTVFALLCSAAYAVLGFYVMLFLESAGIDSYWSFIWMLAWVMAGTAALTAGLMRYTGASCDDCRRRHAARHAATQRLKDPQRHTPQRSANPHLHGRHRHVPARRTQSAGAPLLAPVR